MKKKNRLIILFCTTLVILFIIIYVFPHVTGALKKTEIIEYGSIQVTDKVTAYFIRNENVYFANKSGNIKYHAQEGEMVRKGTQIVDITAGAKKESESKYQNILERVSKFNGGESIFSDDLKKIKIQLKKLEEQKSAYIKAGETELAARQDEQIKRLNQKKDYIEATDQSAKEEIVKQNQTSNGTGIIPDNYICNTNGVVSYYVDGYESEFTPENMALLNREKVESLNIDVQNIARESTQVKEPLYKIVDNKKWYVAFWVAPANIVKYEKGKKITLNLPLGPVEGKIYDIIDDKGEWLVILEFNKYYKEFAQIRKIDAEVVTSDYDGLIIKNESITTQDGQPGVYVKNKNGDFVFKPVKIITSDGESSLVEVSYFYTDNGAKKVETVNIYDEILKKPK